MKKILVSGSTGFIGKNFINFITHESFSVTKLVRKNNHVDDSSIFWNPYEDVLNIDKFEDFDVIIHSHVLEHQSSPEQFFVDVSKFLILDGFHIFSFPNLNEWLSKKYLNCLNFEHTIFLTEMYVDCILKRTGFELLKKIKFPPKHIMILFISQKTVTLFFFMQI